MFTVQQKAILPAIAVPILFSLFFIVSAFMFGNPGFKVDNTQYGLRVSEILENLNPVQEGDVIIAVNGLPYGLVLGYLFSRPDQPRQHSFALVRGDQKQRLTLHTVPHTLTSLTTSIWPHLLLMTLLLLLGLTALLRATPDKTTFLFFLMLCSFSSSVASTMASHLGLLAPPVMSASFFGIAIFNWLSFGAWAHFTCCFPAERDIVRNRLWLPPLFYILPPIVTVVISLSFAGMTPEFWGWMQRLRNIFLPVIICGTFIKHLIDFLKLPTADPARNQIKLLLAAFWLSFGPYLFLYLLPDLFFDHPLIYFRTVILAFLILPIAYLIALLRYRLFKVDKMISRIMAYIILIISITILYSLLLLVIKRWLWGKGVLSEELFLVFLVLVISLFNPAVNGVQKAINRFIFGHTPVPTSILHTLSRQISTALQISDLVKVVTHNLPEQFEMNKVALAVIDNKKIRIYPKRSMQTLPDLTNGQHVIERLKSHDEYLLCRPVPGDALLTEELEGLKLKGWTMVFRLLGSNSLTGILLIGEKTNGRLFNDDDLLFLATLANHTGVALENGLRYERLVRSKKQQEKIFKQLMQSEKMAAIGTMTTTLAHELKNPLATIRSSAQFVAESHQPPEVSQEILEYIIEEVDALNLTINSLLGLARHRAPVFKPVDLHTNLPAILHRWQQSTDHIPEITITCDIPEPLPVLYCDFSQLSQIILNLIRNAEEAMEPPGTINVRVSNMDSHALIRIIDTGPGIDPEHLHHIFQNFFTTKDSGIGLGLPTCRQLVQAHNGSINIKNGENGGIEALILLPFEPLERLMDHDFQTTATTEN